MSAEIYKIITKFSLLAITTIMLISCKSKPVESEIVSPVKELYDIALKDLENGSYIKASNGFEAIFFQHPGNDLTAQAELMQAYSLYLASQYDEAIDVLDVFIKLHPRHESIAYAYYLKALCNYVQISNAKLDQSKTKYAHESLNEVINRFPSSKYAIDAALKIDLVNDHLAGKEMLVGRYYLNKRNVISSLNRFQIVVKKYDTTSHIPEALYRLVEANIMIGLVDEARKYAEVLKYNYSDSSWGQDVDKLF